MLVVIVRTLILYLLVVASVRIMGKRQIGEMQPSELVVAIMISDLASVPMQSIDIPLLPVRPPSLSMRHCFPYLGQQSHHTNQIDSRFPIPD